MPFTVSDYHDLVRLLALHPEWQVELRHMLLSEDFRALPRLVAELVEAQKRTEHWMAELAAAQARTEERMGRLEATVADLAVRMDQLAACMDELAAAQARTEERMDRMTDKLAAVDGRTLEMLFRDRAQAYLAPVIRRLRVLSVQDIEDEVEGHLSRDEFLEITRLDVIATGRLRDDPDAGPVHIAVEVSSVIDRTDVERALRRAELLRKGSLRAVPLVAGESMTQGAQDLAAVSPVAVLLDGRIANWDSALSGASRL
ncbi:MAG: hypothetical protein AB1714_10470 [Acidobacteriota bacterium]